MEAEHGIKLKAEHERIIVLLGALAGIGGLILILRNNAAAASAAAAQSGGGVLSGAGVGSSAGAYPVSSGSSNSGFSDFGNFLGLLAALGPNDSTGVAAGTTPPVTAPTGQAAGAGAGNTLPIPTTPVASTTGGSTGSITTGGGITIPPPVGISAPPPRNTVVGPGASLTPAPPAVRYVDPSPPAITKTPGTTSALTTPVQPPNTLKYLDFTDGTLYYIPTSAAPAAAPPAAAANVQNPRAGALAGKQNWKPLGVKTSDAFVGRDL